MQTNNLSTTTLATPSSEALLLIVAEDDYGLNRLIQKRLQRHGFTTKGALNGADAVRWSLEEPTAILLLDYQLLDMTAKDVILTLAEQQRVVPFIVMTGNGDEQTAVEMMKLGARDYLIKSETFLDLLPTVVQQTIERIETERRLAQTEHALHDAEHRFGMLFKNAPVGIGLSTFDGQILVANNTFLRILGCEFDDLKLINAQRFYVNAADRIAILRTVIKEGALRHKEVALRRRDGTPFFATCSFERFLLEGNEALMVTLEDMSERIAAQQRISHLNAVLNGIRRVNQLIIEESDTDRLIQHACASLIQVFGYGHAWVIRLDEARKIHTTASAGFDGNGALLNALRTHNTLPWCIQQALEQPTIYIHTPTILCNDCPLSTICAGYARLTIQMTYNNRVYGVLAVGLAPGFVDDEEEQSLFAEVARDLAFALHKIDLETERRRAEAELHTSRTRLMDAMQAGNLVWWNIDINTGTMVSAERWMQMLGYESHSRTKISYAALVNAFHPDDSTAALQAMRLHLTGEAESYEAEYRLKTQTGTWRWFHDTGRVTERDGEGRPLRVSGVMVDVTKRRTAEDALKRTLDELEQRVAERTLELSIANADLARAVRVKDEFLANMSHELRTPLNAILGRAEMSREGMYGPMSPTLNAALLTIEESGRHLLDMINDILDVAKIESGHFELNLELVPVRSLCDASMRLVSQQALKKQLHLSLALEPGVDLIYADGRRLKQMLVNLLSNAVKFTPEGGEITLAVRGDREHRQVSFHVCDSGIGIAPEDLGTLFQPFVQVDNSLTRTHEGSGLGLALVARLAKMHGGSVAVNSVVGQGSDFAVILPWRTRTTKATSLLPPLVEPPPIVASHFTDNTLILIVDDNTSSIDLLTAYLSANGARLAAAHNGLEAIRIAIEVRPALILMDIQMPQLNGIAAIQQIRALPALSNVPIIALTALAMPGDRERCLAAGANEYITKPLDLPYLMQLILQLL